MDVFKLDGLTVEMEPSISKWGFEDLEDSHETHRWRATWASSSGGDPLIYGIVLTAYPVIKRTSCGVWINCDGSRQATKQPWEEGAPAREWVPFNEKWMGKRFLNDGSGQAWAKPTQEEALKSLAIRLCRWAQNAKWNMKRVQAAADVLENLRPDWPSYPEAARAHLRGDFNYV
jgi:hypothetical protein